MESNYILTRRNFFRSLSVLAGLSALAPLSMPRLLAGVANEKGGKDLHASLPHGSEKIVILIYPGFTAIDAIGPEYILSTMMGASVQFVAKSKAPVECETRFQVLPQMDFSECPKKPDLVLVPGGTAGLVSALEDKETLLFLREFQGNAKMIGSVCTGSLLLGAAGLLKGYKATSHWQTSKLLPLMGAIESHDRVVFDRDRVTGAGVTAGLDLALALVRHYRGDFYAKGVQLLAQYAPQEPFPGAGDPKTADHEVVALLDGLHGPFVDKLAVMLQK